MRIGRVSTEIGSETMSHRAAPKPKPLPDEEHPAALREIIAEVGATSPKEMGKVMGVASKRLAGRADGRAISEKVKALLA